MQLAEMNTELGKRIMRATIERFIVICECRQITPHWAVVVKFVHRPNEACLNADEIPSVLLSEAISAVSGRLDN